MQKREQLMLGFVVFMAIFLVVGHMPLLLADENDTNNSGRDSDDDSITNNTDSDDEDDELDDDSDDENETEDDEDDEKFGRGDNKSGQNKGNAFGFGRGGRFGQNCTFKVEKEIKIEGGKRVEEVKKKIECMNGVKAEFKLKIENRTEDGRYREKIKYEFEGDELEVEAEDDIDLEENITGANYSLRAKMRNGNFTRIKIMPGTASEIALERLRALNFTIQLREVTDRNVPRVVYNIEANKNGRFLGVFKLAMKSSAEVDPETGEVLDVNVPWWAFLVAEIDDEVSTDGSNDTFLANSTDLNNTNDTDNAAA
ncbi:hypothetical protein A3K62_00885 [Candidatus Pacearchaeota archaeon RBG_16_35_8]|nr:MAG: hypothetical protein A3K62_00885 [Candidatus Pacearchaeota archaeon RBG_16_35_8]